MKINIKIAFFVALLSLFYCVSLIQSTYAKYVSSATANSDLIIARWNINVNDQDIIDNSNFTENLTPVFAGTDNIKSDVVAPTAEGYFDVSIDGTNTDVSFNYTITIEPSNEDTIKDLVIDKYIINNVEYNYEEDITGTINYNDPVKNVSVRVYLKWNDDILTEQMNNADDTEATVTGNANYIVKVNLIQVNDNNLVEDNPLDEEENVDTP